MEFIGDGRRLWNIKFPRMPVSEKDPEDRIWHMGYISALHDIIERTKDMDKGVVDCFATAVRYELEQLSMEIDL